MKENKTKTYNDGLHKAIEVAKGDLVAVSQWSDFDLNDEVRLGIFSAYKKGYFYIKGSERGYKYCRVVNKNN